MFLVGFPLQLAHRPKRQTAGVNTKRPRDEGYEAFGEHLVDKENVPPTKKRKSLRKKVPSTSQLPKVRRRNSSKQMKLLIAESQAIWAAIAAEDGAREEAAFAEWEAAKKAAVTEEQAAVMSTK